MRVSEWNGEYLWTASLRCFGSLRKHTGGPSHLDQEILRRLLRIERLGWAVLSIGILQVLYYFGVWLFLYAFSQIGDH